MVVDFVHTANHGNDVVGGGDLEHGGGQCASGVCGALADGDALDIIVAVHGAVGGEHLVLAGLDAIDGGGIVVGVEDHHVGAAGVLRLIGHDTVGGLEHGHAGVDVIVAGLAEGSDPVAQLDQAPDVVDGARVLRGAIPVDGVRLVTGVIAVVVAALVAGTPGPAGWPGCLRTGRPRNRRAWRAPRWWPRHPWARTS